MNILEKNEYPSIHYFDQDIIALYDHLWGSIHETYRKSVKKPSRSAAGAEGAVLSVVDDSFASFALSYSSAQDFSASDILDAFYRVQENDGAIRGLYDAKTGKSIPMRNNPDALAPPMLVWAEHNYFNRTDNKRRLKTILPKLDAYLTWIQKLCMHKNGLFAPPLAATLMHNSPRKDACYLVDFNAQMALAYNCMNSLAAFVNNRNLNFKYAKAYYNLKALINKNFWDEKTAMYYDIDKNFEFVRVKTLASYWTLLAKIPNNAQANSMAAHLKDPECFYSDNPFPTLSQDEPEYSEGTGFRGSVYPMYTYMVIKGLELYDKYEFARESALKHIYHILDVWLATSNSNEENGKFFPAYLPSGGAAKTSAKSAAAREPVAAMTAVSAICLMIENVIGVNLCTPRKIVVWIVTDLEAMGIESLNLNKNHISILIKKTPRGEWTIFQNTEKLYYFSIKIRELQKEKILPILSGKCYLLVEKL